MANDIQDHDAEPEQSRVDTEPSISSSSASPVSTSPLAVRYAGFGDRFFAYILDAIIFGVAGWLIMSLSYDQLIGSTIVIILDQEVDIQRTLVSSVLTMLTTILFWKYRRATPGKIMMSIVIVDAETGEDVPTGRLILRYFAYLISILPLGLGFLWVAFDERKQGFHDKIANTLVVFSEEEDDD